MHKNVPLNGNGNESQVPAKTAKKKIKAKDDARAIYHSKRNNMWNVFLFSR